jgi:hypothetical protein
MGRLSGLKWHGRTALSGRAIGAGCADAARLPQRLLSARLGNAAGGCCVCGCPVRGRDIAARCCRAFNAARNPCTPWFGKHFWGDLDPSSGPGAGAGGSLLGADSPDQTGLGCGGRAISSLPIVGRSAVSVGGRIGVEGARCAGKRKAARGVSRHGISAAGRRELLAYRLVQGESEVAWTAFLQDLYLRGLQGAPQAPWKKVRTTKVTERAFR